LSDCGWKTIDSAPTQEGVEFLIWNGRHMDVVEFGWLGPYGKPVWFNGDVAMDGTHWMPLPAPPSEPHEPPSSQAPGS
jgi:hypothetical protein